MLYVLIVVVVEGCLYVVVGFVEVVDVYDVVVVQCFGFFI